MTNLNKKYKKLALSIKSVLMAGTLVFQQAQSENSNRFYLSQINGFNGFRIEGLIPVSDHYYRFSLTGPFDFNLDNMDDFLIHSLGNGDIRYSIVFGRSENFTHPFNLQSLNGENGTVLQSIYKPGYRHIAPSRISDINNDGYEDLSLRPSGSESFALFNQQAPFDATIDMADIPAESVISASRGGVGQHITFNETGDINGDGFIDWSIMDPRYEQFTSSCYSGYREYTWLGAHYILLGSNDPLPSNIDLNDLDSGAVSGHRIIGQGSPEPGLQGFESLSDAKNLGDINGDGFDDLGLTSDGSEGCPGYYYNYGAYDGSSYIVFGSSDLQSLPDSTESISASQGFTLAINGDPYKDIKLFYAGDINSDQIDDIGFCSSRQSCGVIFGQVGGWSSAFDIGILDGNNGFMVDFLSTPYLVSPVMHKSQFFDFNGDGLEDLAFAYTSQHINGDRLDEVTVVFGSEKPFVASYDLTNLPASNGLIISLPLIDGWGSISNSTKSIEAGDINQDGFDDVLILAQESPANAYAWVVYGNDSIFKSGFENEVVTITAVETDLREE